MRTSRAGRNRGGLALAAPVALPAADETLAQPSARATPPGTATVPSASPEAGLPFVANQPLDLLTGLLLLTWFLIMTDVHVWLAGHGLHVLKRGTLLLYGMMLLGLLTRPVALTGAPWVALLVFPPILNAPFAESMGLVRDYVIKILLLYWILLCATFSIIRSVRRMDWLIALVTWQFGQWAVLGSFTGGEASVRWHPDLGNSDAFGPLMVIGAGFAYWVGAGLGASRWRYAAYLIAGLCVIGTIASFARGAFLVLCVTALYVWVRSPNKLRTALFAVGGAIIVVIASAVLFPGGGFWHEMSTIAKEGSSEGTGKDRFELWTMAWHEFLQNPVFGVGPGNFGRYAYEHLPDELLGWYANNRLMIFGRALHNGYFEILSEYGAIGMTAFLGMLWDFWRRNVSMRRSAVVARWAQFSGSRFDLRAMSIALECAMVAYLGNCMFYNQLYVHWFWTLLALNGLLHRLAVVGPERRPRTKRSTPVPAGAALAVST